MMGTGKWPCEQLVQFIGNLGRKECCTVDVRNIKLSEGAYPVHQWIERNGSALDIGCGRGSNIPLLLSAFDTVHAIEPDRESFCYANNEHMFGKFSNDYAADGSRIELQSRLSITHADLDSHESFRCNHRYDLVVDCFSLPYLQDREKFWAAIRRVHDELLKPGGWFWAKWPRTCDLDWEGNPYCPDEIDVMYAHGLFSGKDLSGKFVQTDILEHRMDGGETCGERQWTVIEAQKHA